MYGKKSIEHCMEKILIIKRADFIQTILTAITFDIFLMQFKEILIEFIHLFIGLWFESE